MAERVVRNIENDYLMCSVCLGRYEDPRLLPCGHSFCKSCLSEHILQTVTDRDTLSFNCPIDRSQVPKPRGNLNPREWGKQFPPDTFMNNLIQAVKIHEGTTSEGDDGGIIIPSRQQYPNIPVQVQMEAPTSDNGVYCENHSGRPIEFFCLACNLIGCSLCAVREHRGQSCECVTIEEAIVRFRPRIDALRRRFQSQTQRIQDLGSGDNDNDIELQNSKELALRLIDEVESEVGQFYERTLQGIEDLKRQLFESGRVQLQDNQELLMVMQNIESTREAFDIMCHNSTDIEFLNDLPKVESQADEYDNAILSSSRSVSSMQVEFVQNPNFLQFIRNPPPIGSVSVSSQNHLPVGRMNQTRNGNFNTNRRQATNVINRTRPVSRQIPTAGVRPTRTPRPHRYTGSRVQKSHEVINVKDRGEDTISWQLTGVVFVDNSIVVIDSHNQMVRKRGIAGSGEGNDILPLEQPLCVCNMGSTTNVAVTQPEKSQISIIGTSGNLNVLEVIKTHKPYEGICQMNDSKFVVSCMSGRISIDILSRNGRVIKCIERSHLFHWPRFLTIASNGNIIVSDRDQKHVISLNQSGQVVWTYSTSVSPWGVTSDKNGKIYLCLDNNTVQVISEEGRLIQDKFVNIKEGVKTPYAITARARQVAVTEYGSSLFAANSPNVHIFTF
ncbi:uncharacterized protein LOC143079749 [Mytilus galloprovincialis]|uniref:TRIM2_3 n=1 Tax=Mytilus edulis TaxID=6550 RepID=A0A8S3RYK9_MYTED|nr:TRIM2_3 [Mytilus edulis]